MPQNILDRVKEPGFDVNKLNQKEKIQLVRESDGLLIDILKGETITFDLYLSHTSLAHLPRPFTSPIYPTI